MSLAPSAKVEAAETTRPSGLYPALGVDVSSSTSAARYQPGTGNSQSGGSSQPANGGVRAAGDKEYVDEAAGGAKWRPYDSLYYPGYLPDGKSLPIRRLHHWWHPRRWRILYPFHKQLGPGCLADFGVGETLFVLIWLGVLALSILTASTGLPNFAYAITLSTAAHNNVYTVLLGIPFERALVYHKAFGVLAVVTGIMHGLDVGILDSDSKSLTGQVWLGGMTMLVVTSFWPLRRHFFEFFYKLHWVFLFASLGGGILHSAGGPLAGLGLWGFDVLLRQYIARRYNPRSATAETAPCNVIILSFPKEYRNRKGELKSMEYKAGQYVFLCVPAIAGWQYHPFSISSSPHEAEVLLAIRVLGDWTGRLQQHIDKQGGKCVLDVLIDGPYGAPSLDIWGAKYRSFLLVSGGIGITPSQSVTNQLIYEHEQGRPLDKVRFIWVVRDKLFIDAVRRAEPLEPGEEKIFTETGHVFDSRAQGAPVPGGGSEPEPKPSPFGDTTIKMPLSPPGQAFATNTATPIVPHPGTVDGSQHWRAAGGSYGIIRQSRLPMSFQPDLLKVHSNAPSPRSGVNGGAPESRSTHPVVETTFHMTKVRNKEDWDKANIKPDEQACLRMGRPDLRAEFERLRSELESMAGAQDGKLNLKDGSLAVSGGGTGNEALHVAVMVCGPAALINDVGTLCWKLSTKRVKFDFHAETFDF